MNALYQLKSHIRTEADKLACETHPHVCNLRDSAFAQLEEKVIAAITAETDDPPSVQTVLADLESLLEDADGE